MALLNTCLGESALILQVPDLGLSQDIPTNIVIHIVLITILSQALGEWILLPLVGIADVGPWSQRTVDSDTVVVNLVSTSKPVAN
jgi:hypothetical protein